MKEPIGNRSMRCMPNYSFEKVTGCIPTGGIVIGSKVERTSLGFCVVFCKLLPHSFGHILVPMIEF